MTSAVVASNWTAEPAATRTMEYAAAADPIDMTIELTDVLDDKDKAVEIDVPVGGGTIEFCYADDDVSLESLLTSLYAEFDALPSYQAAWVNRAAAGYESATESMEMM